MSWKRAFECLVIGAALIAASWQVFAGSFVGFSLASLGIGIVVSWGLFWVGVAYLINAVVAVFWAVIDLAEFHMKRLERWRHGFRPKH